MSGYSHDAYTNFVQCSHNLRQREGREPLQTALFGVHELADRGRELGRMKGVPHHV